jgi:hypothetical protein
MTAMAVQTQCPRVVPKVTIQTFCKGVRKGKMINQLLRGKVDGGDVREPQRGQWW